MNNILVEVIGTHSCTGCSDFLPEVVRKFCEDTGQQVEFNSYAVWDIESESSVPEYISAHVSEMRKGLESSYGFFLNGHWLPLAHHNTGHVVNAREKLFKAAGIMQEKQEIDMLGCNMNSIKLEGSAVSRLFLADSTVKELGCFSTNFDNIWFFEGSIKELKINECPVEKFIYAGYDINKLIKIAGQHPELFNDNRQGSDKPETRKININNVSVRLLTEKDLSRGYHPCIINGCKIDKDSKLHKAVADKFGGWGYEATYISHVCGYMGIMPKDISYRDANYLPPGELPYESVLLLTCYAGGGVFGPQFHRIGIATKLIHQAISDAKAKGYLRIEAYAHPEALPVLEKCGFTRIEWETDENSPQMFYSLDLN